MRVRARKDFNHTDIVGTFRACGCSVLDTASLGKGAPDIIVGLHGHNVLVEIKDGKKPPSKRKLTPDEAEFARAWNGAYRIINSVDAAIQLVKELSQ